MVSFNSIPSNWKLPGTSIEVDPSQAGTPTGNKYALLVGHKTNAGTAAVNIPIAVANQQEANSLFGDGSMLATMFRRFFEINKSQTVMCLPIAEVSAGTAATNTITVAAAATASGVLALYVAGQKIDVSIASTDTTAGIATKIGAAINAATDLPVTATVLTNVVTLTAKWKGLTGNDLRLSDTFLGAVNGEYRPAGLALTYPARNFTGGTGTPDLTTAIANLGDLPYYYVAMPFTDTTSLNDFATEFGFGDGGRWGWMRQTYGQVFSAIREGYSVLFANGPTRNHPVIHALAVENWAPTSSWSWAAAFTAQAAKAFTNDPARPLQTLTLPGILPAARAERFSKTELNALAGVGYAIQGTEIDGQNVGVPTLLREQSMYQKNTLGQADNAYELATTLATLSEIFTRMRQRISNKYPRHKLANDGTRFGAGQAIVTPKLMKAEIISHYEEMEADGLVENTAAFKAALIVVRSSTEPNTLECEYTPDLINQKRRFNVRAAFRLQFPTSNVAA